MFFPKWAIGFIALECVLNYTNSAVMSDEHATFWSCHERLLELYSVTMKVNLFLCVHYADRVWKKVALRQQMG